MNYLAWTPDVVIEKVYMKKPANGVSAISGGALLRAGTPLNNSKAVANTENAKYLVAEDYIFYNDPRDNGAVKLITAGYVDLAKAEAAWGKSYTDEAKAALAVAGINLVSSATLPNTDGGESKLPVVTFGTKTTIVDTTTVMFSKDGDNNRYISSVNPISGMTYKANTVYKVTWDGVEYECFYSFLRLKTSAGAGAFNCAYIGNAAILDCDNTFKSDDTVPFIVAKRPIQTENNNIYILTTSTAASHTIKIEEIPFTKVVVNRLYYDFTAKDNDFAYRDGSGDGAIMLGAANKSSGESSVAAGDGSIATEMSSIALGHVCAATAAAAIATGAGTTASGQCSHTEGTKTIASASSAHAEGLETIASGRASHTEGQYTVANHLSQHVFGIYNIPDPSTELATAKGNYVEIVGNGTADDDRSNARTLDWNGNETLAGSLTLGSTTLTEANLIALLASLNE